MHTTRSQIHLGSTCMRMRSREEVKPPATLDMLSISACSLILPTAQQSSRPPECTSTKLGQLGRRRLFARTAFGPSPTSRHAPKDKGSGRLGFCRSQDLHTLLRRTRHRRDIALRSTATLRSAVFPSTPCSTLLPAAA